MKKQAEVLAPAGSMESMMAAVHAGADAVYMGGSRFGARAYADNPEEDRFLEAIDYAHLHGCRLYMTVNTLVKERELGELYGFLRPCYERGLDGVIVQDLGVLSFVRQHFPDLPVHASTQMTVTGPRFARILKEQGASRIVTARELSLGELARIHREVDIEIESFVHGALCYCYSGQCLLSSFIGGRSGNRGRCAQPCRLPYDVQGARDKERYVMNLKDLCTLDILPDILEAGVYSLKIEGRMKSPRYTAGVVSVYRKYVDRYLARGREGYQVDPADQELLLDLFDRGGHTDGYYRRHNGRDMVALKEKPAFRQVDQELFKRLDAEYVNRKKQEPVRGVLQVTEGEPVRLEVSLAGQGAGDSGPADPRAGGTREQGPGITGPAVRQPRAAVTGPVVQSARSHPMTSDQLRKQMEKTGNSPFCFEALDIRLEGSCFLPVQAVNQLRRQGFQALEEAVLTAYRRDGRAGEGRKEEPLPEAASGSGSFRQVSSDADSSPVPAIHVLLENPAALEAVLEFPETASVYLDAGGFGAETWKEAAEGCHRKGKQCVLAFPYIFRPQAEHYFLEHWKEFTGAGFDQVLVRSLEEAGFLKEQGAGLPMIFDAGIYAMNHRAAAWLKESGAQRLTLPLELNAGELRELLAAAPGSWELPVYGHLPAMVSAQCVRRTKLGCDRKPDVLFMKDRTGKQIPVRNVCRFCYNMVYNPEPLSLAGMEKQVKGLGAAVIRLQFSVENASRTRDVIRAYVEHFRYGKDTPVPVDGFTRGHIKRGVE